MKTLTVMVLATMVGSAQAVTFYVDNQIGSDANTGELPALQFGHGPLSTIQAAVDKSLSQSASTNVTIRVKGTPVRYATFEVKRSNLTIVGYANTLNPSDLDDNMHQNVPVIPVEYGGAEGARAVAKSPYLFVPLIDGHSRDDRTKVGINLNGKDDVTVRNFYITGVFTGVGNGGLGVDNCTIENIFCFDVGTTKAGTTDGWGILIHSGEVDSDHVTLKNCTVLNSTYAGIEMKRTKECLVSDCRVYADDNSTEDISPTDYYFLIAGGYENTFTNCFAGRYPDDHDDDNSTPPIHLKHSGHGFAITALETWGMTATRNTFSKCQANNIGDFILLRGANASCNTFEDCSSVIEASSELESGSFPKKNVLLGRIQLTNGPHHNTFRRIHLVNSDIAIQMDTSNQGNTPWAEQNYLADNNRNTAEGNLFENCIFECELGISFSDMYDEYKLHVGMPTPGGDMIDGSQLDVVDNHFIHCTFIGSDEIGAENAFFLAGREASGNTIVNCVITRFAHYAKYFEAAQNYSQQAALDKVRFSFAGEFVVTGFGIRNSSIYNPNELGNEKFPVVYGEASFGNSYAVNPDLDANFYPGCQSPILDIANPDPLPTHSFPLDFAKNARGSLADMGALERNVETDDSVSPLQPELELSQVAIQGRQMVGPVIIDKTLEALKDSLLKSRSRLDELRNESLVLSRNLQSVEAEIEQKTYQLRRLSEAHESTQTCPIGITSIKQNNSEQGVVSAENSQLSRRVAELEIAMQSVKRLLLEAQKQPNE